jgi:hypothetical protein
LPIAPGDSTSLAYTIWPFGVHGSSHAVDGHPGYDFEYPIGARVLAAADGTVDNVITDINFGDRFNVQLRHACAPVECFTDYTNLASITPAVVKGARIARGEPLGVAGGLGLSGVATSAMTHFQLVDPNRAEPALSNVGAVGIESYVSPTARAQLDALWRVAAYRAEWCEPFLTNSRAGGFPFTRTWQLQSGAGPATIVVTCRSDAAEFVEYSFAGADGGTSEAGSLAVRYDARPTTADFRPAAGAAVRLALYDIVGGTMQLAVGAPGAPRPSSLAAASTYTTR